LIEGIDGSGKDTFAEMLAEEIKKRFRYSKHSTVSVTGQPLSCCKNGEIAKKFVETLDRSGHSRSEIERVLTENRQDIEKRRSDNDGILICIRGILTEMATYRYIFEKIPQSMLGQDIPIDKLIIVDVDASVADRRIEERGKARTYRESLPNLNYFRDFFLSFDNPIIKEKIIVHNTDISSLHSEAECIAGGLE
jgi:thymidylate kinase